MKIKSVRIRNFRSFQDETILFNDYTCLVGANGCGKSTVFAALNVFFRETGHLSIDLTALDAEDFHMKNTDAPVDITVTFAGLSEDAQKEFADYYRQGELVVSAVAAFDSGTRKAQVKQYGQRSGMKEFAPFFKAAGDGAKVGELKQSFAVIRRDFTDVGAAATKDAMISALREYEAAHPELCTLLPSEDEFYGVSRGANRIAKHLQWVFVPAVKDAASEQTEAKNTALGKLLARTVRAQASFDEGVRELRAKLQNEYQALLDSNQQVLEKISASLNRRLAEWSHPDASLKLEWQQDPRSLRVEEPLAGIIAGEGQFEGNIARFGHGLQRSFLLALLQELATTNDSDAPRMILAVEEPELFQHPPQARYLATVLSKLSRNNSQIMVCTHSPVFVSGDAFEDVRMVRKCAITKKSAVTSTTIADINKAVAEALGDAPVKPAGMAAKIHQSLQPSLNEIFFAATVVLVEGLEDVAYLAAYLTLREQWEEFRRLGCHIVPVGGKSRLIEPLAITRGLKIPTYVIFDADGDTEDKDGRRAKQEKDNKAILQLVAANANDPFPGAALWGAGFAAWPRNIGATVMEDIGAEDWKKFRAAADAQHGHVSGLAKNTLHIGTSLALAWEAGKRSANLAKLCDEVLAPTNRIVC